MTPFEGAPVTAFHRRLIVGGAAGQFSDGFSLGIIGIALNLAKAPLGLSSWWMGALGAASLIGLFCGSLVAGAIADRFGRRPVFAWGMLVFTAFGILQYFSTSAYALFAVRFLLGVTLGADYVSCKAMVTEYSPTRSRGQILSMLPAGWTSGFFCAFLVGYLVRAGGPDAWRVALLASAVPSFAAFLLRFRMPESPYWLVRGGRIDEARTVVTQHLGEQFALPEVQPATHLSSERSAALLRPPLVYRLLVGGIFHTSQVVPTFALAVVLPIVMAKIGAGDGYTGALIYNVLFLFGALIGPFLIDRIPRRALLIYSFVIMAVLLGILATWRAAPPLMSVSLFATFAFVLSVAGILQYVYPPELFPTQLRARGIGSIIAISRFGSAISTFILPAVLESYGVQYALGSCMVIMILAAGACYAWAPETLRKQLD